MTIRQSVPVLNGVVISPPRRAAGSATIAWRGAGPLTGRSPTSMKQVNIKDRWYNRLNRPVGAGKKTPVERIGLSKGEHHGRYRL